MLVRGTGIRDIAEIENINIKKSVVGTGALPAYDQIQETVL
jgi:hypothetical protein